MSSKSFKFEIVTPFKVVYSGEVQHIKAPGIAGYFGVLAGHTPFLTALRIGEIKVTTNNTTLYFATSGGFTEVGHDSMTVLAETAEAAGDIDLQRAQAARDRALKRLKERHPDIQLDRAHLSLFRAINRINIAKKA